MPMHLAERLAAERGYFGSKLCARSAPHTRLTLDQQHQGGRGRRHAGAREATRASARPQRRPSAQDQHVAQVSDAAGTEVDRVRPLTLTALTAQSREVASEVFLHRTEDAVAQP